MAAGIRVGWGIVAVAAVRLLALPSSRRVLGPTQMMAVIPSPDGADTSVSRLLQVLRSLGPMAKDTISGTVGGARPGPGHPSWVWLILAPTRVARGDVWGRAGPVARVCPGRPVCTCGGVNDRMAGISQGLQGGLGSENKGMVRAHLRCSLLLFLRQHSAMRMSILAHGAPTTTIIIMRR